jgi:hypothetical protein
MTLLSVDRAETCPPAANPLRTRLAEQNDSARGHNSGTCRAPRRNDLASGENGCTTDFTTWLSVKRRLCWRQGLSHVKVDVLKVMLATVIIAVGSKRVLATDCNADDDDTHTLPAPERARLTFVVSAHAHTRAEQRRCAVVRPRVAGARTAPRFWRCRSFPRRGAAVKAEFRP